MFILAKRNIILPNLDHTAFFNIHTGQLVEVPDIFCETPYFAALVKDGKISVPQSKKDKDVIVADEKAEKVLEKTTKRTRKAKK